MKKAVLFVLSILFLSGILCFIGCKEAEPVSVSEVYVETQPLKSKYFKGETVTVQGGVIGIRYSDGSVWKTDMLDEMHETAVADEYGTQSIPIRFTKDEKEYSVEWQYDVLFSEASHRFAEYARSLPMLNQVTAEDSAKITEAFAMYSALTDEEKAFIRQYEMRAYEKIVVLEKRVLPLLEGEKKDKAVLYREYLNTSDYAPQDLKKIHSSIENFLHHAEYTSLEELENAERELYTALQSFPKNSERDDYSLSEHRKNSYEVLRSKFVVKMYNIGQTGEIISVEKDFGQEESHRAEIEQVIGTILLAQSKEEVNTKFAEAVVSVQNLYLDLFKQCAGNNLSEITSAIRSEIEDHLNRWERETVSADGLFSDCNTDYMNDNRWWIPKPYRVDVLLNSVEEKLNRATCISEANQWYEEYAYEIIRAVYQRNLELFYAIERNLNVAYDSVYNKEQDTFSPTNNLYWAELASYWGASARQQFIYDGIIDAYRGEIYGSSDSNPFRFNYFLYSPAARPASTEGLRGIYVRAMENLQPLPKLFERAEIVTFPKVSYELNEQFTVNGGVIKVIYSDHTHRLVEMTDDMYTKEDADTSKAGGYHIEIRFTEGDREQSVTLAYSVGLTEQFNALLRDVDGLSEQFLDADAINACIAVREALSAEERTLFNGMAQGKKLARLEKIVAKQQVNEYIQKFYREYDFLNICNYSKENQAVIGEKFKAAEAALKQAETAAQAIGILDEYNAAIAAVSELASNNQDLGAFRQNSKNTADQLAQAEFYNITSEKRGSMAIGRTIVSFRNEENVKKALEEFNRRMDGAETIESARNIYRTEIEKVLNAVLDVYAAQSTENILSVIESGRATVKYVWEENGFYGDKNLPVEYEQDAWEYLWWTPECFRVSTLKANMNIRRQSSRTMAKIKYEEGFVDMLRSVMYRNIYTVFQYNLRTNPQINGKRWSVLSSFNSAPGVVVYQYDGCLEQYQGTKIDVEFRLWGWGFDPSYKVTVPELLVEKYNWDINEVLLPNQK